jgi:hypothetical protein
MNPSRLLNSSLEQKVRRAIDNREGDKINDFIRSAGALDLKTKGHSATMKPTLRGHRRRLGAAARGVRLYGSWLKR